MTRNTLTYLANKETARSNLAKEALQSKELDLNYAKLAEEARHNLANERYQSSNLRETIRNNKAMLEEKYASLGETQRSNIAKETQAILELQEIVRKNDLDNSIKVKELLEKIRSNDLNFIGNLTTAQLKMLGYAKIGDLPVGAIAGLSLSEARLATMLASSKYDESLDPTKASLVKDAYDVAMSKLSGQTNEGSNVNRNRGKTGQHGESSSIYPKTSRTTGGGHVGGKERRFSSHINLDDYEKQENEIPSDYSNSLGPERSSNENVAKQIENSKTSGNGDTSYSNNSKATNSERGYTSSRTIYSPGSGIDRSNSGPGVAFS